MYKRQIERYTASGLGGVTVPRAYGGADVSYATLAEVFALLSACLLYTSRCV